MIIFLLEYSSSVFTFLLFFLQRTKARTRRTSAAVCIQTDVQDFAFMYNAICTFQYQ